MKRAAGNEVHQHKNKVSKTSSDREPVQVYCRLRPLQDESESPCVKLSSSTTLSLTAGTRKECNYVFKHIFTSHTGQSKVFQQVGLPLLEDLINGKNGLLFAYGVTGSGKTFTLTGEHTKPGIIPQCIHTLFNTIESYQAQKFIIKSDRMNGFVVQSENDALEDRFLEAKVRKTTQKSKKEVDYANDGTKISNFMENNRYTVFISYVEIYNNIAYDLLEEPSAKAKSKVIREDSQKNTYISGVTELEVKSANDTFELFHFGQKRKRMGMTALNDESSRSHSIFTIRVVQLEGVTSSDGQPIVPDQNVLKVGQLCLVDLAGSERCSRTQTTGMRLKEASSINNSLMSLRICLEILRENQLTGHNRLVPYRDCRLTMLFKNYFEGEGHVRMIVCLNPAIQDCEENVQVLKFAEMTRDVKVLKSEAKYIPCRKIAKSSAKTGRSAPTPASSKVKESRSSSFKPKVPTVPLNMENPEQWFAALDDLTNTLAIRKRRASTAKLNCIRKVEHFRSRLSQLDQEAQCQNEIQTLKISLRNQKRTTKTVAQLETFNNDLNNENKKLREVVASHQGTMEEKNFKTNQNFIEIEKIKQKFALKSAQIRELDEKLRRQHEHLQIAVRDHDAKLKKAKEVLSEPTLNGFDFQSGPSCLEPLHDYEPQQTPPQRYVKKPRRHRRSRSAN